MSRRALIISATSANAAVAAISYLAYGWTVIGAHVAARWTARFSVLIFLVAFAQPGLRRWFASLPSYATIVHTFVAEHCVHFATVAVVLALDKSHHLKRSPGTAAAVIGIGSAIVLTAGITAGLRQVRVFRVLHGITIYGAFLLFMAAFATHRIHALRAIAALLVIALGMRMMGVLSNMKAAAAAANSA